MLPTLVPAQHLARFKTNNDLQNKIEELWRKQHVIAERLKPWAAIALQISQDVDGAIKRLTQTLESVTVETEGMTSHKLVDIAQSAAAQSQEVLPPLIAAINALCAQVETAPPQ